MRFADAFHTSWRGVTHAKVRSLLTMLGIVIGIASVILLISIGRSAERFIIDQVQGIGSNLVFVVPGSSKGSRFEAPASSQGVVITTLTRHDADAFGRDDTFTGVAPEVRGSARVVYQNNDVQVTYEGVTQDFFRIRDLATTAGTTFTDSDVDSFNRVAVIGSAIAETLFGASDPIGKQIRLKDISFRVIGVLEKKGVGPMGIDQDQAIVVPITVAQHQMLGISYYNLITLQARTDVDMEYVKSGVTSILRQGHRIINPDKDDFTIRSMDDALEVLESITSVMTMFLTAIASISLVVGGIGIMNIMLVSVVERTKEVGLRKALGATDKDIVQQFLLEAVMLTFLGGVIGIASGAAFTGLAYLLITNLSDTAWTFELPLYGILLAFGVSIVTGLVFGIYPARQAARKSPMEALRYE